MADKAGDSPGRVQLRGVRLIYLKKELQPDGLRWKKLEQGEHYDPADCATIARPLKNSVTEPEITLPREPITLEEYKQLMVWFETGSAPLVGRAAVPPPKKRTRAQTSKPGGLPRKSKKSERENPRVKSRKIEKGGCSGGA